jgi:hypothetical protein
MALQDGAGGAETVESGVPSPAVRMAGYLLAVTYDGWERFCADLQMGPDLLMGKLRGWDAVCETEAVARRVAFTPEQVAAWRSGRGKPALAPTAEDVARTLRALLDEFLVTWH